MGKNGAIRDIITQANRLHRKLVISLVRPELVNISDSSQKIRRLRREASVEVPQHLALEHPAMQNLSEHIDFYKQSMSDSEESDWLGEFILILSEACACI